MTTIIDLGLTNLEVSMKTSTSKPSWPNSGRIFLQTPDLWQPPKFLPSPKYSFNVNFAIWDTIESPQGGANTQEDRGRRRRGNWTFPFIETPLPSSVSRGTDLQSLLEVPENLSSFYGTLTAMWDSTMSTKLPTTMMKSKTFHRSLK